MFLCCRAPGFRHGDKHAGQVYKLDSRDARLPHALGPRRTKIVIFVRSRDKPSRFSAQCKGREQQRRGFVLVDAERGSLADIRSEIEGQKMPLPASFLFVLDLPGGIEDVIAIEDEMQVLVSELAPAGRAVVVYDPYPAVWYRGGQRVPKASGLAAAPLAAAPPAAAPPAAAPPAAAPLAAAPLDAAPLAGQPPAAPALREPAVDASAVLEAVRGPVDNVAERAALSGTAGRTSLAAEEGEGTVETEPSMEETLRVTLQATKVSYDEFITTMVANSKAPTQASAPPENSDPTYSTSFAGYLSMVAAHAEVMRGKALLVDTEVQESKRERSAREKEEMKQEMRRRELLLRGRRRAACKIQAGFRIHMARAGRRHRRHQQVQVLVQLMEAYVHRRRFAVLRSKSVVIQSTIRARQGHATYQRRRVARAGAAAAVPAHSGALLPSNVPHTSRGVLDSFRLDTSTDERVLREAADSIYHTFNADATLISNGVPDKLLPAPDPTAAGRRIRNPLFSAADKTSSTSSGDSLLGEFRSRLPGGAGS